MPDRHLTLLTGASRGMGLAMAEQLVDAGHALVCISRKTNDALAARARAAGVPLEQWPQDLARAETAAARLQGWLAGQDSTAFASITLINNAGLIPRIAPLGEIPAMQLAEAMRVDLEAPMLLTAAFLAATGSWKAERKVLNISSGLGRRAMASQAPYCAAKAGMENLTGTLAVEWAPKVRVNSVVVGMVETEQSELFYGDAESIAAISAEPTGTAARVFRRTSEIDPNMRELSAETLCARRRYQPSGLPLNRISKPAMSVRSQKS